MTTTDDANGWGSMDPAAVPPGFEDEGGWGDPVQTPESIAAGERLVALAGGDPSVRLASSTPAEEVTLEGSIERHPAGRGLHPAEAIYEPATGRVFRVLDDAPVDAPAENLPAVLAGAVGLAVRDWTNPDEVGPFAGRLRAGIVDYVQGRHVELVAERPEGKRLTTAAAQPELVFLAQSSATLDAIGDAVKAGAKEARDLAGEVLVDLNGERALKGGTVSERVSDQHGGIRVTRTQATETVVDREQVVDVLVASLVDKLEKDGLEDAGELRAYALGMRDGIAALVGLVSPLKWKTTAIDALVQELERRELEPLAIRLDHAQGKKPKGNPSTKVERTAAKA